MNRNLITLIIKLERRIINLEKALGIIPDQGDLVHPKSITHAEFRQTQKNKVKK